MRMVRRYRFKSLNVIEITKLDDKDCIISLVARLFSLVDHRIIVLAITGVEGIDDVIQNSNTRHILVKKPDKNTIVSETMIVAEKGLIIDLLNVIMPLDPRCITLYTMPSYDSKDQIIISCSDENLVLKGFTEMVISCVLEEDYLRICYNNQIVNNHLVLQVSTQEK